MTINELGDLSVNVTMADDEELEQALRWAADTLLARDAEIERLKQPRMFPLMQNRERNAAPGPLAIPWSVAEKAYGVYASRHGRGQSLERLAERGGFGVSEMDDLYPQWRTEVDRIADLERENAELRELWMPCDQTVQCALCGWVAWEFDGKGPHSDDCPLGYIMNLLRKTEKENAELRAIIDMARRDMNTLRNDLQAERDRLFAENAELKANLEHCANAANDPQSCAALALQNSELRKHAERYRKIREGDGAWAIVKCEGGSRHAYREDLDSVLDGE